MPYIKSDFSDTVIFGCHHYSFPPLIIFSNPILGFSCQKVTKQERECVTELESKKEKEIKGRVGEPVGEDTVPGTII